MAQPNAVVNSQVAELESIPLAELEQRVREHREGERVELGPTERQRLGGWTVAFLILNRTIGTGIFAQPSNVLYLTGSPSVALILWIVGGLIVLSIALSWLELGLTIPRYFVRELGGPRSAPRSGGDKNYLEYIYRRPRLFMSCVFGITFILFGNVAGNAIQLGIYMQTAISPHCDEDDECFNKGAVIGWAIGVLALCCFLNVATRELYIILNNIFAGAKLLLVAITAFLGIGYGTAHGKGCLTNMALSKRGPGGEFGDIALAIFYSMYSYSGFEQPFYVLAEVRRPGDTFAKSVLLALGSVMILFPLTNVGYFCVVPYDGPEKIPKNMALEFFDTIAGNGDPAAASTGWRQGVSAVLALVSFGSIMAQTFTGSRVKQEIAKEAVIPFAWSIASAKDSLYARYWSSGTATPRVDPANILQDHPEQVPMAATLLHFVVSVVQVVGACAATKPSHAYRILTYLRMFSIVVVLGLLTVGGLAYLKIDSWRHGIRGGDAGDAQQQQQQQEEEGGEEATEDHKPQGYRWLRIRRWHPWLDWVPTFTATAALLFLSFAVLAEPSQIRKEERAAPYWVGPVAGWLVLLFSVLWWACLRAWQWKTGTRTEVLRRPDIYINADGTAVYRAELIEHRRGARLPGKA